MKFVFFFFQFLQIKKITFSILFTLQFFCFSCNIKFYVFFHFTIFLFLSKWKTPIFSYISYQDYLKTKYTKFTMNVFPSLDWHQIKLLTKQPHHLPVNPHTKSQIFSLASITFSSKKIGISYPSLPPLHHWYKRKNAPTMKLMYSVTFYSHCRIFVSSRLLLPWFHVRAKMKTDIYFCFICDLTRRKT